MGLRNNTYATIKTVENKGNFTVCKITVGNKDKQRGKPYCSFVAYATFVGEAHKSNPQAGQKIKITSFEVTNGWLDKFTGEQKFNDKGYQFTIYEYTTDEAPVQQPGSTGFGGIETLGGDDLPF